MVGDVDISPPYINRSQNILPYVYATEFALSCGLLASTLIPALSRRNFLQAAGFLSFFWGGSALTKTLLDYTAPGVGKEQDGIKRTWARIMGASMNLHPEDPVGFFRSALMALKLMTVASEIDRPIIAFQTEGSHSNIEDFLQLGPELTRQIILDHDRDFLSEMVNYNGGIEKFCTSRLLKLPTNFKADSGRVSNDIINHISERKIIDRELQKGLQKYNLRFNP